MHHRTPMTILAVALIGGIGFAAGTAIRPGPDTAVAGGGEQEERELSIPEIAVKDMDGVDLSLHALLARGPVLLDFWALWCRPCLKELPELDRLHRKYSGLGFTVIAVNTDTPVDVSRVKSFIRSRKYGLRVISDLDGELRRRFQVNAFPTALLIATDGTTIWSNQGYRPGDEKELEKKLQAILPEGAEKPPLRAPSDSR